MTIERRLVELRPYMMGLAIGYVRCRDLAEDVVQTVCIKAITKGPGEPRALHGWVAKAVYRASMDELRRPHNRREVAIAVLIGDRFDQETEGAVDPHDHMGAVIERAWLDGIVAELPPRYRAAIPLIVAGLTRAEIAARFGGTQSATRDVIWRGRRFAASLDPMYRAEPRAADAGLLQGGSDVNGR